MTEFLDYRRPNKPYRSPCHIWRKQPLQWRVVFGKHLEHALQLNNSPSRGLCGG